MACTRCGGTMVMEEFSDDRSSTVAFEGQRCLNCGHIEDAVIHHNRRRGAFARISRPVTVVTRDAR